MSDLSLERVVKTIGYVDMILSVFSTVPWLTFGVITSSKNLPDNHEFYIWSSVVIYCFFQLFEFIAACRHTWAGPAISNPSQAKGRLMAWARMTFYALLVSVPLLIVWSIYAFQVFIFVPFLTIIIARIGFLVLVALYVKELNVFLSPNMSQYV